VPPRAKALLFDHDLKLAKPSSVDPIEFEFENPA
jgi:hypothetical protein